MDSLQRDGEPVIVGIDPGARYTGVCARRGDKLLLASTYVREDGIEPVTWAVEVATRVAVEVVDEYGATLIGIENVAPPQSHFRGQKSMLNPKNLIHLALVVGSFARQFPTAVLVKPGNNGSQALESYPSELQGRRPATLAGVGKAGTRNHERSAWDVSLLAEEYIRDGYKLDMQQSFMDRG